LASHARHHEVSILTIGGVAFGLYSIARHNTLLNLKQARDVVLSRIATLTPRERQVFELDIRGKTNKQVADALGGTERTIKAHRHMVMEKMQVRSLAELVSLAERVGVLDSESGSRHTA
jgi:FixJ family two-component response regulator